MDRCIAPGLILVFLLVAEAGKMVIDVLSYIAANAIEMLPEPLPGTPYTDAASLLYNSLKTLSAALASPMGIAVLLGVSWIISSLQRC